MNGPLFLGIDGGATNCRARIVDGGGSVLGEGGDGIELHIHDPAGFLALPVILEIFAFLRDRQPALLAPSEFLDHLSGGPRLRAWCETPDAAPDELLADWSAGHDSYRDRIAPHLLYPGSK